MDLKLLRNFALTWLLVAFVSVTAPAVADVPAPPSLTNLPADWWSYVSASPEEERGVRVGRLRDALQRIASDTSDPVVSASGTNAVALIDALLTLASRRVGEQEASPAIQQSYTFAELIDAVEAEREATLEANLLEQQLQREAQTSRRAEGRLSDKKAAYLRLEATNPERLLAGLRLIESRLQLAVESEERRLRQTRLERWRAAKVANRERVVAAIDLLAIDEQAITAAEKRASDHRAAADKHAEQTQRVRARRYAQAEQADEDDGNGKLQAIQLIAAEALTADSESSAMRYALQAAYLRARLDPAEENVTALREARTSAVDFVAELDRPQQVWREVATRERQRTLQLIADSEGQADQRARELAQRRKDAAEAALRSLAEIDVVHQRLTFIEELAAKALASHGGSAADLLPSVIDGLESAWGFVKRWSNASLFEINATPVTLFGIFRVVLIFVVAIWISKLLRHALENVMQRGSTMSRSSVYMLGRIFHYVILLAAVLASLSSLGLDFTNLAFVAGALGVGIGFGLQAIFSNFISGIIVLFERSLKVGDYVELESGVTGEVREINIRSTLITTNDNVDILVPNSEFVNGRVINWTLRDVHRRMHVPFGVAYASDKDLVKKAALEAAHNVRYTLQNSPKRVPEVWLTEFGDSSLNFELVVWLTADAVVRPGSVHAAYLWEIESALAKYDIEIPFPQRDLNVRSFFGKKDAAGFQWFDENRQRPEDKSD